MRVHGTLATWNDERGFGFIDVAGGSEELFVHISAFPRDGGRPRIGEMVSFESEARGDGKKRAVRVMRPGSGTCSMPSQQPSRASLPVHRHMAANPSRWWVPAAAIGSIALAMAV